MPLHILLADDSVPAQNMGKKILTDAGFEVTTASNGLDAIRKIADSVPDVAVLDIFMPGYSGLEVCQKLRASAATATLPVILTVGKLEPYRPEDGASVHSNAVIVKPFIAAELVKTVQEAAGKSAQTAPSPSTGIAAETHEENDEPIFSYTPTIPDRETLGEDGPFAASFSSPATPDSPDNLLFNPEAKHVPFSASAIDLVPSISMGETRGAPVESVIADVNLETEEKSYGETVDHGIPLLAPQELLPEITPPPLDIPSLDPLLDIPQEPAPSSILEHSPVETAIQPQTTLPSAPEAPQEELTPEEEARRKAFEDLFNSDDLPPLEEPATASLHPPSAGTSVAREFAAADFALPSTGQTADAPEPEAQPSAETEPPLSAAFEPHSAPQPEPEEKPDPLLEAEGEHTWNASATLAEFSLDAEPILPEENTPEWSIRGGEFTVPSAVTPPVAAEARERAAEPEETNSPRPAPVETAAPAAADEIPAASTVHMDEPEEEHSFALEEPADLESAGVPENLHEITARLEAQVKQAIAAQHPDAAPAAESAEEPEVILLEEAKLETAEAITPPEEAPESIALSPAPAAQTVIAEPEAQAVPQVVEAVPAETTFGGAETALPVAPAPAEADAQATAPAILEPVEEKKVPAEVAGKPLGESGKTGETESPETIRSAEAERMHQAVERVIDRFKPLLIAAIVRELARTDTE